MADVRYASQQAIREEAGLQNEVRAEPLNGVVDGVNKSFTTNSVPLCDRNYDDVVSKDDVIVYVDNVKVALASIEVLSGTIVLSAAPALNADVTVDYATSAVKDGALAGVLAAVQEQIDERLTGVVTPIPYDDQNDVPATISDIAKRWAAGLLLQRDYGLQSDTTETSKDGSAKVKDAKADLESYAMRKEKNLADGDAVDQMDVESDGQIFTRTTVGGLNRPAYEESLRFNQDVGIDEEC